MYMVTLFFFISMKAAIFLRAELQQIPAQREITCGDLAPRGGGVRGTVGGAFGPFLVPPSLLNVRIPN